MSVCVPYIKTKRGERRRLRETERQRRKYWDGKEQFIYITVCQNVIMAKKSILNRNEITYDGSFSFSKELIWP